MNEHQQLAIKGLKKMLHRPRTAAEMASYNPGQGKPQQEWWEKENERIKNAILWITEQRP